MTSVLKKIKGKGVGSSYKFGNVISVSDKFVQVRTTTGLEVKVNVEENIYLVGDQVVMGVHDSNLNDLFIIKKVGKKYPETTNLIVNLDED